MLELRGISKHFPGVKALDDVDFGLEAGEIHALLGENGAGKSTLIKVITGVYHADGGSLTLEGVPLNADIIETQHAGISTVYQEVNLVPNLSVAHNLFLGNEPRRFGCIQHGKMREQARRLLEPFRLDIDVSQPVGRFSVAVQQLVAIARGTSGSARVLILDEPTASLDEQEVDTLFSILDNLRTQGMAILFVTHFLEQVYRLCDRMTVLRNGSRVGCWTVNELPHDQLVAQMLGRELEAMEPASAESSHSDRQVWLQAEQIHVNRSLAPVSLSISQGEAVGLAGLLGSGRTELCRALFGLDRLDGGRLLINSSEIRLSSPADAIFHGMVLCPEDRKVEGIIGPLSVTDNMILTLQVKRGWLHPIGKKERDALVKDMVRELGIKTSNPHQALDQLSGGNQQKVLLARAMLIKPQLLILDEPTRGIDIGAHADVIRLIRRLCEQGLAVLVTSSELEELVQFADRVAVMRERHKTAELTGEQITEAGIMAAIARHDDVDEAREQLDVVT